MVGEIVDADWFEGEPVAPAEGREEPADQPSAERGGSWRTNQTKSVNGAADRSEEFDEDRELPTPGDVASRFFEEHYELAKLPLTRQDGRSIRSELLKVTTEIETIDAPKPEEEAIDVEYIDGKNPVTWGEAVVRMLQDHEDKRNTMLHLARGNPGDPLHATFDTPAESRFMASYQKKYFAQLKACLREFVGAGERPSGESPDGIMEDPKVVLLTRTASSTPNGDRLGVIDHFDQLRESWSDVRNTIRNTMEKDLGLDSGVGWVYDRRLEPHPGDGANQCYPHEHVVLLVDSEGLTESDFRKVVEKHVDSCDAAGRGAHDLDVEDWDANRDDVETVSIRDPAEIENLAAYVADYASIEPADLLERSTDYVAFAAAAWATSTRTITRSDPMVHASTADACKQRFEDGACDQELDHAEEVRRKEIRGVPTLVCAECKSPHGIDQSQTLIEARSPSRDSGAIVADGGFDPLKERKETLRERLGSARAIASCGETLTRIKARRFARTEMAGGVECTETTLVGRVVANSDLNPDQALTLIREERAGYDRLEADAVSVTSPPEWRLEAVSVDGERHSVSSDGGGVDRDETQLTGDLLRDWVLEHTDLEEMAADTGGRLNWRGWYQNYRQVAGYVADRAGPSVERCEHIIEEFVSVPSQPNPRVDDGCWECGGTYEYQGCILDKPSVESIYECWSCGDRHRVADGA